MSGGMSATTITMLAITAAGTVASMANSAAQADQQAEYSAQQTKMMNDQAALQQASIGAQASQEEAIRRRQLMGALNQQAATWAGHGADINSSSSLGAIQQASIAANEQDIQALKTNASTKSLMSSLQASQQSYALAMQSAQANGKMMGSMFEGMTSLGKTGMTGYQAWDAAQTKKAAAFPTDANGELQFDP